MNVESIVATAASGTVVLAALAHGGRKALRFCRNLAAAAQAGAAAAQAGAEAAQTAANRSAQLEPNGGSSVRDAVTRIEGHLKAQDQQIAELRRQISAPRGRWRY